MCLELLDAVDVYRSRISFVIEKICAPHGHVFVSIGVLHDLLEIVLRLCRASAEYASFCVWLELRLMYAALSGITGSSIEQSHLLSE